MTDFLDWQSEISLEQVFATAETFSYPHFLDSDTDALLYLTVLKKQKSRAAIMLKIGDEATCITPGEFALQTKVNEYGGKPFWLFETELVFANQSDQCLYRQIIEPGKVSKPTRLTPVSNGESLSMYTDVNRLANASYIAIVERENRSDEHQENVMSIVMLSGADDHSKITELSSGADFYSNLVVSKDARRVAWVQWQHPNMPWDETELWTAEIEMSGDKPCMANQTRVELDAGASVCQLIFSDQGALFFSADYSNNDAAQSSQKKQSADFWNIHCYRFDSSGVLRVTDFPLEFGYPHWVYGDHRIVKLDTNKLMTVASDPEGDSLYLIDTSSLEVTKLSSGSSTIQHLSSNAKGRFLAECLEKNENPKLIEGRLDSRGLVDTSLSRASLSIVERMTGSAAPAELSLGQHISYKTRDGREAYGFFYQPSNAKFNASEQARPPPVIVMVHGGPTARAYGHFDIQKQFWTSRGFALFDVNPRGSSGYGRAYRDGIYQHWGELDTADIIDGIETLIAGDKIDRERVCIRGKSSGGYAVLRALTEYPNHFKAGACYYGIGNLVTLAEATHKFEKYYTDRLIGEAYSRELASLSTSRFHQRSPIHKINQVKSAMIVFQGLLDKIVPPQVAQEVIDVLRKSQLEHAYVEYGDEGHGFRQVTNNIDAWGKELAFYRRILRSS